MPNWQANSSVQPPPGSNLTPVLATLPPGSVVWLTAGEYTLDGATVLPDGLVLAGSGSAEVCVRLNQTLTPGQAFTAEGLTLSLAAKAPLLLAARGFITLLGCALTGAGDGIVLAGEAAATLTDSRVGPFPGLGIDVSATARLTGRDLTIRRCLRGGLAAGGHARVALSNSLIEENGGFGLKAIAHAHLTLDNSLVLSQAGDGVSFEGAATGSLYGSLSQDNCGHGVLLKGRAVVSLMENTMRANALTGFACLDEAGGEAGGNQCDGNRGAAVYLAAAAAMRLTRQLGGVVREKPAAGRRALRAM